MSNTIIVKPGFNYMARFFGTKELKKGTSLIIPEGIAAEVYQDGKKLCLFSEPATVKVSKKTIPGLKTSLFKKDIDKIAIACFDKSPMPYTYKMFYRKVKDFGSLDENSKRKIEFIKFCLNIKVTLTLDNATTAMYFVKGLKLADNNNVMRRYQLKGIIGLFFDQWACSHVDALYDLDTESGVFALEKTSDGGELFASLERYIEESIKTNLGYKAKVECLGVF